MLNGRKQAQQLSHHWASSESCWPATFERLVGLTIPVSIVVVVVVVLHTSCSDKLAARRKTEDSRHEHAVATLYIVLAVVPIHSNAGGQVDPLSPRATNTKQEHTADTC